MSRVIRLMATGLVGVILLIAALGQLMAQEGGEPGVWRIKIKPAAVVQGPVVLLGEIALPVGDMEQDQWRELSVTPLWPSPPEAGRPMAVSGDKLKLGLEHYLGQMAQDCILPQRIVLQRGGKVYLEDELSRMAVEVLNPMAISAFGPEAEIEFREWRIPAHMFLADTANQVRVECVTDRLDPGRNSLRFVELSLDQETVRRVTGNVFVDVWVSVPVAAHPLNKGDELGPREISYARKNLAYLTGDTWDGLGGARRVKTAIGTGQVIYEASLDGVPLVAKGDSVTMIYEGENITLSVPAEVLADAGKGESVVVRNLESQREVYARVRDANTVVVQ